MKRRKFIALNGWFFGGTLVAGSSGLLMNACASDPDESPTSLLGEKDAELLNELSEIIIPETDTPGGREAKAGQYIVLIHNDCLDKEEQVANKDHLEKLKASLKLVNGNEIETLKRSETIDMIHKLDAGKDESFRLYKNLIVSAFLTSELGTSKFLKFSLVPGRYEGCTPHRPW